MPKTKILADETVLSELEGIAYKLRIDVKCEPMETKGGLCKVKGKQFILINETLSIKEKAKIMAEALSQCNIDDIFILPKVREIIEKQRELSRK